MTSKKYNNNVPLRLARHPIERHVRAHFSWSQLCSSPHWSEAASQRIQSRHLTNHLVSMATRTAGLFHSPGGTKETVEVSEKELRSDKQAIQQHTFALGKASNSFRVRPESLSTKSSLCGKEGGGKRAACFQRR
jgi:hypothetical protein